MYITLVIEHYAYISSSKTRHGTAEEITKKVDVE